MNVSKQINHPFYTLYEIQKEEYKVDDFKVSFESSCIQTLYFKEDWVESKIDVTSFPDFMDWLKEVNPTYVEVYKRNGKVHWNILLKELRTSTVQEFINYKLNK